MVWEGSGGWVGGFLGGGGGARGDGGMEAPAPSLSIQTGLRNQGNAWTNMQDAPVPVQLHHP